MCTGIATVNDVTVVVFLNFGPESAVGSIQYLITDYSKTKKMAHDNFKLDETGGEFSMRVETLWKKGKNAP